MEALRGLFALDLVEGCEGVDVHALALVDAVALKPSAAGEVGGALIVVDVGHGHTPEGHGAGLIQRADVSEAALGLEVPEAVEEGDALVEEGLDLFTLCRDGEGDVGLGLQEIRGLPGPLVERLPVD